jgi:glucoamylase
MANAVNDGYLMPEQIWDRVDISCFGLGKPTGSAAPLMWAEGQYVRLAQSIDAGHNVETPLVVQAHYGHP